MNIVVRVPLVESPDKFLELSVVDPTGPIPLYLYKAKAVNVNLSERQVQYVGSTLLTEETLSEHEIITVGMSQTDVITFMGRIDRFTTVKTLTCFKNGLPTTLAKVIKRDKVIYAALHMPDGEVVVKTNVANLPTNIGVKSWRKN